MVAVDIQPKMLASLKRRAARAGLSARVDTRVAAPDSIGVADLAGSVDLVLAFTMVHELPPGNSFFAEAALVMKPGGRLLFAEPAGHVNDTEFQAELAVAAKGGLTWRTARPYAAAARLCSKRAETRAGRLTPRPAPSGIT